MTDEFSDPAPGKPTHAEFFPPETLNAKLFLITLAERFESKAEGGAGFSLRDCKVNAEMLRVCAERVK